MKPHLLVFRRTSKKKKKINEEAIKLKKIHTNEDKKIRHIMYNCEKSKNGSHIIVVLLYIYIYSGT